MQFYDSKTIQYPETLDYSEGRALIGRVNDRCLSVYVPEWMEGVDDDLCSDFDFWQVPTCGIIAKIFTPPNGDRFLVPAIMSIIQYLESSNPTSFVDGNAIVTRFRLKSPE